MLEVSMQDKDIRVQPVNQPLKQPSDHDSRDDMRTCETENVKRLSGQLFTRDTAAPAPG